MTLRAASPPRRVRLLTASGCHLCEDALGTLERVRADTPFELEIVDVGSDPELERRYRRDLPVVEIDGERVFTYVVQPDALRELLARPA